MIIHCDIDRYIREVIENGEYGFLFEYPVVIDVGANIGTFSFWIYNHCNKIYAIEPAKENCDNFKKTIQDNHLDKIQLFEEAITCKTGINNIRMFGTPGWGGWTTIDPTGKPEEYRQVKTVTLRDFMDRENILYADLVKIDVEGAEEEILTSLDFPKERIGTIIGELHVAFKSYDIFKELGYSLNVTHDGKFIARKK